MRYEQLPVYRATLKMCVYVEEIVKGFDKYHKYNFGSDLRDSSKRIIYCIGAVSFAETENDRLNKIRELRDMCEQLKMLVQIGGELRVFHSFSHFQNLSGYIVDICRQVQAWLNKTAGVRK